MTFCYQFITKNKPLFRDFTLNCLARKILQFNMKNDNTGHNKGKGCEKVLRHQ